MGNFQMNKLNIEIPKWENPLVKYETNTIKRIILNLKTILANKTEIMELEQRLWDRYGSMAVDLPRTTFGKLDFNLNAALCFNADLYSLVHLNPINNENSLSTQKYLACKFRNAVDGDIIDGKMFSWTYPIDVNRIREMWRCEQRWEFAEFCLDELEYLFANGNLKGI